MINNINNLYNNRFINKIKIFFLLFTLAIAFSVAASETKPLNAKQNLKVITLAPHITELVYAAGAGHNIIGTVSSSNYPKQAKQIHKIGDGLNINIEHLLSLEPDVVYAWQDNFANQKVAEKLKTFNIEVLFSEPINIHDIPNQIKTIGKRLNTFNEAQVHAQALEDDIKALEQKFSSKEKISVFIEVGTKPIYTLGNDPLINSTLELCGAVNIFSESAAVAPTVNPEQIMQLNPDIIIVTDTNVSNFAKRVKYWEDLNVRAAKNHNIYTIDPDQLLRPGPRLIYATQKICKLVDNVRISNTKQLQ